MGGRGAGGSDTGRTGASRRGPGISPGVCLVHHQLGDRLGLGGIEARGLIHLGPGPGVELELELGRPSRWVKVGRPDGLSGPRFAWFPGEDAVGGERVGEEGDEAHALTAAGAGERECIVDTGEQGGPAGGDMPPGWARFPGGGTGR